jgi:AbrB family looped-hinge helix DNA binding protein
MLRAKIDKSGRLSVPAAVRRAVGLESGGEALIDVVEGELRVSSLERAIQHAQAQVRRYTKGKVCLTSLLFAQRRREAKRG